MNDSNLIPIKKGHTGNPNGRPKKLFTQITNELKELGFERVTASNITEAYELFFGLTQEQIESKIKDKDTPMILRIVGKSLLSAKGFEILEKMLDRVHGKLVQRNENLNWNFTLNPDFATMDTDNFDKKKEQLRECLK